MEKKLITWSEEYELGFKTVDEQHEKLVDLINKLYNAFMLAEANEVISGILDDMLDYTVYHFKAEEDFFEAQGYSDSEKHKKEHELFVEKTKGFVEKFSQNDADLTYDVMNFLRGWLLAHILGSDKEYSRYFISKGVTDIG